LRARVVVSAVGAVLAYYGAVVVIGLGIGLAVPNRWIEGPWGVAVSSLPAAVAALGVTALVAVGGWSSWRTMGWPGAGASGAALVRGTVVGCGVAATALVIAVVVGGARIEATGEPFGAYAQAAGTLLAGLAVAALAEELLFRGFPLARLAEPFGRVGASVLLAGLFAAAHFRNPDLSALGLVNIALASLVLSAAFFTPGGLPMAWGVHWGWNGGLVVGADAPVSGLTFDMPALEFYTGRATWVTGGAFGPEGGIAASIAMALALIWLGRRMATVGKGEPA
jgi:membrane protease YdiL (CAAX protease family)